MQNIDPVLLVAPAVYVVLSTGLVLWWHYKRRLTGVVLFLSAVAYFGAISLKVLFQGATYGLVQSSFGAVSIPTGLYFGLQTSFFEVGGAFLVATFAVARGSMEAKDGEGYGISLAFWENGVLLGALTILSLALTYLLIAQGLLSQSLYQTVVNNEPSAFYPPLQLLGPSALGILERISSLLVHFSWGYLCVLAAYLRKRSYLYIALPMGLIDATVPFAGEVPPWAYETGLFLLSLGCFAVAWKVTEKDRRNGFAKEITQGTTLGPA